MKTRFAFVGFRHGHIFSLLAAAKAHPQIEIVALCEEDPATRDRINAEGFYTITHSSYETMLAEVPCDVIAIGDYFGIRGSRAIAALKAGKHVIADKPLCTSLAELDEIASLSSQHRLQLGLQLDLRDTPQFLGLREVLRSGLIGELVTLNITAQHPLMPGQRAAWYFEPGKQGGTINDIAIHAFDLVPWLTGHRIAQTVAARSWNGKTPAFPHFKDSGQLLARLDNGAGFLADVSYTAPDKIGYQEPTYWNIVCHGTLGVASANLASDTVRVVTHEDTAPRLLPLPPKKKAQYLEDFLLCIQGRTAEASLTSAAILLASRETLTAEAIATE